MLVTRRVIAQGKSRATFKGPQQINAPQPRQMAIQFRAPPPMSFHPNRVIGSPSLGGVTLKDKEEERLKVFTTGGQKFTTLSSLRAASSKRMGEKDA